MQLEITVAHHFLHRAIGLLGQRVLDDRQGLLIIPCNSIHTLFMRMAIDVVFIDRCGQISRIIEHMPPWRCAAAPGLSCLELGAGNAALLGLHVGLRLPQLAHPVAGKTVLLDLPAPEAGNHRSR
ncbi:MAG: uncharacterized membrane protein (UPF0127 family) [Janthinobacterium sp.]|jgi:uncharacterized membrane protein (UPF0127 family)